MKEKFSKIQVPLQGLVGILVLANVLIVTFGVFARQVGIQAPWTDEMLRIIFVWLVFIMAAVGFHTDDLIGLDLLEDMIKKYPKVKGTLKLFQAICGLVFGIFMAIQTYQIVATQFQTGELTPVMSFPLWLKSFGYFAGCALFVLVSAYKVYQRTKSLKSKEIE